MYIKKNYTQHILVFNYDNYKYLNTFELPLS